jgi:hypothetical protein
MSNQQFSKPGVLMQGNSVLFSLPESDEKPAVRSPFVGAFSEEHNRKDRNGE